CAHDAAFLRIGGVLCGGRQRCCHGDHHGVKGLDHVVGWLPSPFASAFRRLRASGSSCVGACPFRKTGNPLFRDTRLASSHLLPRVYRSASAVAHTDEHGGEEGTMAKGQMRSWKEKKKPKQNKDKKKDKGAPAPSPFAGVSQPPGMKPAGK